MNPHRTLLVIPCYRDGERLADFLPGLCAALETGRDEVDVQVVEDGSPHAEQLELEGVITSLRQRHPFLLPLVICPVNRGKGHAIQTGWTGAPGAGWLAFVDADGAVPAAEVVALLALALRSPGPAVFIGDRTLSHEKTVQRFWHRRLGSRLFNAWVRLWLRLGLTDTQCGLKVIPASLHAQAPWREDGFAFDLELLLRARATSLPIFTQPIEWREKPGSSLGPRAMLGLFLAAYRLRR